MIIQGNLLSTTLPKADYGQEDVEKGSYIHNKPDLAALEASLQQYARDQVTDSRTSVQLILAADGWTDHAQTVAAEAVTENALLFVSPAPEAAEEYTMYLECGVRCSGQEKGQLTFSCEELPTIDLTVNAAMLF